MFKSIVAAAVIVATASATDLIYTTCSDGACQRDCQKTLVKSNTCTSINNGTQSLTAALNGQNVGLWHMDTFADATCSGPSVRVSGVCNSCSANGMIASCGGLPGAMVVHHNCPRQSRTECGDCKNSVRLLFGTCTEIIDYTPKFAGYKYALANWGCVTAGTVADVDAFASSNTCGGSSNQFEGPIGVCDQGTMFEVANSTVSLK